MSATNAMPFSTALIAFFPDREEAYDAITDLKDAGFSQNEIGLAIQGEGDFTGTAKTRKELDISTWQKIKDFFTGQPEMYDTSDYDSFFGHLNLARDQSMYYRSGLSRGGAVVTVKAMGRRQDDARKILSAHDADLRTSGFERVETAANLPEQRIQLSGELLRTVKERVQKGEVRLRKEVVTEQKTMNVPVSREEVVIEHVPPSERTTAAGARIEEGKEIRIPVSEERVRVEKEPVATGEVRVGKRTVEETQQVSGETRHEELKVDKEGDAKVRDSRDKRAA